MSAAPNSAGCTSGAERWGGTLILIVCATLWSLNGPLIKLLDREAVPAISIACFRSLVGGLILLPFGLRYAASLRSVPLRWPVWTAFSFTFMTTSFVAANILAPAATAIVLQYTAPVWVFLLSPLLVGERAGRAEGGALAVAMLGVLVIFGVGGGAQPVGLMLGLLSGLGFGLLTVLLRKLRTVHPLTVATLNALGSGLVLLPAVLWWGSFQLSPFAWLLVGALAVVQFTLPYVLYSWALQRVVAHRAALILLLEPVLNPIWTYLAVGEHVPLGTLMGGPLIVLSVAAWLLLAWRRDRQRRNAARHG
ncbi:MAG: DMT family transporter [Phycisphaerales bacterium]|nr:DMT family transporter [Phycisphaerales bacterium]